nr:hypothetical protein BaRGS_003585 [Batillaria attramentaria]
MLACMVRRTRFSSSKEAMGVSVNRRGFNDRNLYVAQTTQDRVVPVSVNVCEGRPQVCNTYSMRVSYAIPLELTAGTGGFNVSTAFNGTNHKTYMLTPAEFFVGGEHNPDPADTVRGAVGVLDRDGVVRRVSESGMRIMLPEIVDVGKNLRTRPGPGELTG